jgi:hypothetical protein
MDDMEVDTNKQRRAKNIKRNSVPKADMDYSDSHSPHNIRSKVNKDSTQTTEVRQVSELTVKQNEGDTIDHGTEPTCVDKLDVGSLPFKSPSEMVDISLKEEN